MSKDNNHQARAVLLQEKTYQDEANKIQIITKLKKCEISVRDIPYEYRTDKDIIAVERKTGLRRLFRCGYDVIQDHYFVEEDIRSEHDETGWSHLTPIFFEDFQSFFQYLDGNIYENSCYYLLDTKKVPDYIDKTKLYNKKSFVVQTVSDYTSFMTVEDHAKYDSGEKRKRQINTWIDKFNKSLTFSQLKKTVRNYNKSSLSSFVEVSFYFWQYIFEDVNDESRFKTIMEYMSSGIYPSYEISNALCSIYNPDSVVENYKYELGSYQTCRKHIRAMRQIAERVKEGRYKYINRSFFDERTHFYCVETQAFEQDHKRPSFSYRRYFDDITGFVEFLNGDLTNCDLSNAHNIQNDFSKCIIDETTKLPTPLNGKYDYTISKEYQNGKFLVCQDWRSMNGNIIKSYKHEFDYFFDFLAFLKGDLKNADLISCDGLIHIIPTDQINLQGALVTSEISEKWGIPYIHYEVSAAPDIIFEYPLKNESQTTMILNSSRELVVNNTDDGLTNLEQYDSSTERIYYISDIHLYHLLKNRGAKSKSDIIKIIRDLAATIIRESRWGSIILIDGDTSLDFTIFKLFVSALARCHRTVIFTIGNHDIWSCPDDTIDQLAEKYRDLLKESDMYLLQNDVLFINDFGQKPVHISEQEINDSTEDELRDRVRLARLILFGGTGFAGYNQFFNAETGLYQHNNTIGYNRDIELKETQRFEKLYTKIANAFHGKNTVIMTHMPLPDWYRPAWEHKSVDYAKNKQGETEYRSDHSNDNVGNYSVYQKGFIYINGHTHRNYYYDDGSIRIYADNQFGYNKNNPGAWPHLKYFEVDKAIDLFEDYDDGIYEISADDYRLFYRCKNIFMNFNRETNIIYMLKKAGYYCFIHKAKNCRLSIMNGGALRSLACKDINYYYDNMDLVVTAIKNPLIKYTTYQKQISEEIKKLGGIGSIHGCIVDINFYNHIYVDPIDNTIIGYWANDIINKLIYPTIPALLEEHCPELFARYQKMLAGKKQNNQMFLLSQGKSSLAVKPVPYLDTDIYKASRQIKKMQRLSSSILSIWPDVLPNRKLIEG